MCDVLMISNLCLVLSSIANIPVERLRFTKILSLLFTFILILFILKINCCDWFNEQTVYNSEQYLKGKLFSYNTKLMLADIFISFELDIYNVPS